MMFSKLVAFLPEASAPFHGLSLFTPIDLLIQRGKHNDGNLRLILDHFS